MPRRDLVRTTASVDGVPLGEFRTFTGGALTSAEIKSPRGAGQGEVARGGRQTVENVTIAREDQGEVDLKWLASRRGRGRMVVTRQPLDDDGNPRGKGITYTGILLRVAPGEGDTGSDTDLDEFELECSTDSVIG
jgi:hypothetical protein